MPAPTFASSGFIFALFLMYMMPGTSPSTPCTSKVKKHGRGKAISSKEKVIMLNIWDYFKGNNPKMTTEEADKEVAKATGISQRSVLKARVEMRQSEDSRKSTT